MKSTLNLFVFFLLLSNCNPSKKLTNSLEMTFVFIEPGTFLMGDDNGMDNEKPAHEVTINNGFYIQTKEVTVGQFREFIKDTDYKTTAEKEDGTYVFTDKGYEKKEDANWRNPYFSQDDNHPVVCISRNDIDNFIIWLSGKEGNQYRLPTEAEWEYACRAGSSINYFWGDSISNDYCWYKENAEAVTHPVGKTKPNSNGLYDMLGNVMEACSDIFDKDYYKRSPAIDPEGPDYGNEVVFRGGAWYFGPEHCRCSVRFGGERIIRSPLMGFRLVITKE